MRAEGLQLKPGLMQQLDKDRDCGEAGEEEIEDVNDEISLDMLRALSKKEKRVLLKRVKKLTKRLEKEAKSSKK